MLNAKCEKNEEIYIPFYSPGAHYTVDHLAGAEVATAAALTRRICTPDQPAA